MNVIRKINSKGSCFYGEKDKEIKINYDNKITCHDFSPVDNHFGSTELYIYVHREYNNKKINILLVLY